MRNFILGSLVSVGLIATSTTAVLAHGTTLASAMAQAYTNSNSLQVSRAGLRQTDEGVAGARSNFGVQVDGTATTTSTRDVSQGTSNTVSSVSVSGSKLLYDGGRTGANIDSAKMGVLAARQALIAAEQSVLLDAVTAFMDVRQDRDALALAENNVRVLRQQLRAARDRFEVGEVTRTDVSQTEARLASSISSLETARGDLRISEQAYLKVIGSKPGVLHAPSSTPKLPSSSKSAETLAVQKHPRVQEAQFNVKGAEYDLERANLNKKPSVRASLTGTVQRGSSASSETDAVSARLQATLPIYQGGQLDVERRSAIAALDQAKATVQVNAATTRENVNRAYTTWLTSRAAKKAVQSQIRSAEIAYEGVREEAKLGARTTLDALDAEQELLSARSSLISATRNEYVAAYSVLAEMGLLTVEHLGLGVATYDPNVNYEKVNGTSKLGNRRLKLMKKLENR